ncbi:hypothetical protein N2152v2_005075 [Parachlorella kessleri]
MSVGEAVVCEDVNQLKTLPPFRDAARLEGEWFDDQDKVRGKVGLIDPQPATPRAKELCKICFEQYPVPDMCAARCKHYYCKDCWHGYIQAAIESGPTCLDLRCPDPECKAVVPQSIVLKIAEPALRDKYQTFQLRSFVEDNKRLIWCPLPGCEHAVEALADVRGQPLDVFCKCGGTFCFNCKEEAHRPADCETVRKWMVKNSAESENLTWILANTKQCPKCSRPIEKNQGCMHMTCSQCRHEFCWLCLGSWAEHGERTGGFYQCNKYRKAKEKGEIDEDEQKRQQARQSLERYMHYWQRWAENDKARKQALKQMDKFNSEKMETLSERTATPTSQLKFVLDGWMQVVDCRRILKWTYALGYYTFEEDLRASKAAKEAKAQQQEFFEFNQGQAEHYLEKLHHKLEKELAGYLKEGDPPAEAWPKFREQLIGMTDVTRTHFHKLVDEFEQGVDAAMRGYLEEEAGPSTSAAAAAAGTAAAEAAAAVAAPDDDEPGPSKAAGKRTRASKRTRNAGKGAAAGSSAAAGEGGEPDLEGLAGFWQCAACTFANTDMEAAACEMCQQPRHAGGGGTGGRR